MKQYVGSKAILARPMTRQEYNDYRDWQLPADENGADEGFLVEYIDGGQQNDPRHKGYISWSPADVFHNAYRPNGQLTFGDALMALESGHKVARAGWNGKGMWIVFINSWQGPLIPVSSELQKLSGRPFLAIKSMDGLLVPWLPSQTDVLAKDWGVIE